MKLSHFKITYINIEMSMMGLSEIRKRTHLKKLKKNKKMEEMVQDLNEILRLLAKLHEKLSEFEKKWGSSREFLEITQQDTLEEILVLRQIRHSSILDKLTGRYYDRIAFEILKLPTELNKPVISIPEITINLVNKFGKISRSDIDKAIEILKKKRLIVEAFNANEITYIVFPEVYDDIRTVLDYLKSKKNKETTIESIATALNWEVTRAEIVLEKMVKLGLMAKDPYPRKYWLIK